MGIGSQVKFKAGFSGALKVEDINALEQAAHLERGENACASYKA
jgi:hypothetical protein